MPVIRASLLAVFALISCALALNLARAQDPTTETGTTLHPGLNLVGWTAEPTPTAQLFDEIPQLEAVWAWDAELDDWITAARGAPEWLGGLGRLTPGMGLRMQLSGDQPFNWQRSTEPTRGLVELRAGWNLVAWSGADETPIDDALKGIGWSLRNVHRWNPITQQWSAWTSPERTAQLIVADNTDQEADSEIPTIRRGEALWINVARAVNWLQPTDILPRLVFPGGASDKLQARAREDLEAVLNFYRTQYGIQADLDFTIYAAKDVDALLQAYRDDGQDVDDAYEASTRARWNRVAGWAGGNIVVKQTSWPDDLSTDDVAWARYTITHEYFHILQDQLSDGWASQWLVEGTASWVDDEHKVLDEEQTYGDLRDRYLSEITDNTPTLRSTEDDNAQWEYTLGWLATDQLTANASPNFTIEFWRHLTSTEIGPHGRWASTPDWRTALQQVSGQTVSEFYTDFDAWQQEQATANPASASPYDGASIRGRVMGAGGEPVAGVFVNAIRVEGETSVGWNQRAETDANGRFAVRALEDSDYRLSVDINDDCTRYYADGQLINDGERWDDREEARSIRVSQADVTGIDIQLPPNVCGWQISGRIVGLNAEPLAGIRVSTCPTGGGGQCYWSASTADGSFTVAVNEPGEYRISANLGGGCSVYFRSGLATTNWDSASPVMLADAPLGGILIQVPENLCQLRVGGFLDGIERFLDGYVSANLCRITDDGCSSSTSRRLGNDGSFAVATPTSGAYRLTYNFDGCSVHYGPTGVTANAADAALINVDSRDMRVAYRQVPADVCAYEIGGTLIGADSQPLADTWVSACLEEVDGNCVAWPGAWTDDDGAFAITVPVDGAYRLSFGLDGCTVYFGSGDLTGSYNKRTTTSVNGRDVRLNPRQIPAKVCGYQIIGSIRQADGQPLAGAYVSACFVDRHCAVWPGVWTDDGGKFAITAPEEGVYRISFDLGGCTIHFRRGGLTTFWKEGGTVTVSDDDVRLNPRSIPEGMCALRITGRLVDVNGAPVAEGSIRADGPRGSYGYVSLNPGGRFEIRVPYDGPYIFGIGQSQPYCHHTLAGQALGSPYNPVRVNGADVTGITLRLPGTIEELCK